jgi:hypothetical protein
MSDKAPLRATADDGEVTSPMAFRFRCFGRRFAAEVEPRDHGAVVRLAADAGVVPYSAESPALRRRVLAAVAAESALFEVLPDQRIRLRTDMRVAAPLRPARVIAAAAALAISSVPALDRIAALFEEGALDGSN